MAGNHGGLAGMTSKDTDIRLAKTTQVSSSICTTAPAASTCTAHPATPAHAGAGAQDLAHTTPAASSYTLHIHVAACPYCSSSSSRLLHDRSLYAFRLSSLWTN
jgi:hypothetical protein